MLIIVAVVFAANALNGIVCVKLVPPVSNAAASTITSGQSIANPLDSSIDKLIPVELPAKLAIKS